MSRWLAEHKPACVTLALALVAGCVCLTAQQPTVFRADVKLVHVIASVKNSKNELVGRLQKSDFRIFDNGVEQEIKVFEPTTAQPLSVALMIDVSGSTAKDLKYETDSAAKFLHALLTSGNPDDAVALYSFDADVNEVRPFTHNYPSLESALRYIHGSGGTSLYDAIYLASQRLEERQGRKVLILITDGGNTTSNIKDIHPPLKEAQLADAVIYPVVVLPITNEAGRNTGGEHALQFLAEGTGGHTFDGKELDKAFADLILELRTQYFLAFYPTNVPLPKDPFHKLEVRVSSPDLHVSTRSGYYGDSEGGSDSRNTPIAVTPAGRKKK